MYFACVVSSHKKFRISLIVNPCSLCANELSSDHDVILFVFMSEFNGVVPHHHRVRHLVRGVDKAYVCVDSCQGIFVESFVQGKSYEVLEFCHAVFVAGGIAWQVIVAVVVFGRFMCHIPSSIAFE